MLKRKFEVRRMRNKAVFILSLAVLIASSPMAAQSDPPTVTDQTLSGTGGRFEHVELSNGGVNLSLRLVSVKARGIYFEYNLNYSIKICYLKQIPGTNPGTIEYEWTDKNPWTAFGTGDKPSELTVPVVID